MKTAFTEETLLAQSSFERWMITIAVMLATVIEVLDMTIVNVSLTPMMGSLGAGIDQITWVLTSYIVSSAIFMPLTGFLVKRFGRKRLLIYSIIGFLISSLLCGLSSSLTEIVAFRVLQGIFGASLVPLSQIILRQTYPKQEHGQANAIWGIGIMVAPILGPTLGGYITEYMNWRWVFYINIPVCIIALYMASRFIKETPTMRQPIDWLGMSLLALGVGSFQIFLDRGNNEGWFHSHFIMLLGIVCVASAAGFIMYGIRKGKTCIINLSLFSDRNFTLSCILLSLFMLAMFAVIGIQPILLEHFMGYPAETAGLVSAPRGIASACGMFLVGRLVTRFQPRYIIALGVCFTALGAYLLSQYNLLTSQADIMFAGVIQGFGMGLFFVPLATIAYNNLSANQVPEAAGIFSVCRNIGGSIGISIFSTVIARESQINWNRLGEQINLFNPNLHTWLNAKGWQIHEPIALGHLAKQLGEQSGMVAFVDAFYAISIFLILLVPIIFLLQRNSISS